jgi:limonene-1,2-epoxide hydrolase
VTEALAKPAPPDDGAGSGASIVATVVRSWLAAAVFLALLAGCGGGKASPESVVRAWSKALNANDNEAAAKLFAPNAEIYQGAYAFRVDSHRIAVLWNNGLPCAGKIVFMRRKGTRVLATFLLGERPKHKCDGPGEKATALFDVRNGKIVLWAQVPNPVPQQPAPKPKPKTAA